MKENISQINKVWLNNPRKIQFVAVRMELELFRQLKQEADQKHSDLSTIIRERLRQKEGDHNGN